MASEASSPPATSPLPSPQGRNEAADHERRERSDALDALLPTLATALDVREVFKQVSAVAREVVPHELLVLGLLSADGQRIQVYAVSAEVAQELPEFVIPEDQRASMGRHFILHDMEIDPASNSGRGRLYAPRGESKPMQLELDSFRTQLFSKHGLRSLLRVPVRLRGETGGALLFGSRDPRQYREDDVDLARRIADHVSLALSHQRLADEQKRATEAAERARRLEDRVERLTAELQATSRHRAVGHSKPWRAVLAQATKVAATETNVLLNGESGTGKEVLARFIHRASPRAEGPFVGMNCAALPETLLESELFGHEKGAFTGAISTRPGRLEQAAAGVLFLDEVGEMTPAVQAKLLRVLQEREFQRLGGTRVLRADVRIIAATNRDLSALMAKGLFREDLFYRLQVFDIRVPPLRERRDDILLLVDAFLKELGTAVGRPAAGLAHDARDVLLAYSWPGNVRELRNALERAVILCEGGLITREHLPIGVEAKASPPTVPVAADATSPLPTDGLDIDAMERDLVTRALAAARQNKSKAAKLLGLTRAQLYSRLGKHGLS